MSMIDKLDAAYEKNPDPDHVAQSLYTNNGWLSIENMTETYFNENIDVLHRIVAVYPSGKAVHAAGPDWVFTACARTFSGFMNSLSFRRTCCRYWVIPSSEYVEGQLPS